MLNIVSSINWIVYSWYFSIPDQITSYPAIMYEPEEDYMEEGDETEEISNEIWQEACWTVISAYFEEKGTSWYIDND